MSASGSSLLELPEAILVKIFCNLSFAIRRTILLLVCKSWQNLTAVTPVIWETLTLSAREEGEAFSVLQRAGLTGGLQATPAAQLRVRNPVILRWVRKHPDATVRILAVRNCGRDSNIYLELALGGLTQVLLSIRHTLRHLCVPDFTWVSSPTGFPELGMLLNLETLDLFCEASTDDLSGFLGDLSGLTKLQSVRFSLEHVGMFELPASLFTLRQIRALGFDNMCACSPKWDQLRTFEALSYVALTGLTGSSASQAMAHIADVTTLESLDLNLSFLGELPDLRQLQKLRILDCSECDFQELPVSVLTGLKALEVVDFGSQRGTMMIPESVFELACLERLRFLGLDGSWGGNVGQRGLMQLMLDLRTRDPSMLVSLVTWEDARDFLGDGERSSLGSTEVAREPLPGVPAGPRRLTVSLV